MVGFLSHLTPEENSEVLNATCGPIRGNIYKHNDKIVDGYLGIPFAKPPIGSLRFKKPVEGEKWAEPKDCYKYGPACPQTGFFASLSPETIAIGEDNCLTLNVFAPRWKSKEFENGFPVMVYFYGGGFETGCSGFFNDYSLTGTLPLKDVIVVTANYRVGPLGFLTTGDDVSRGNYGLWDQTLALQWVQKHIGSFGGDNKNVTVFGTSAGGASADLLALSPHSNKLFHRLIGSSGSAYCNFAVRSKQEQAKVFEDFAKFHGYTGSDSESLLSWYDAQPISLFKQVDGFKREASSITNFVANIDGDFFPKHFDELRREAPRIDAMLIVGENEGLGMTCFDPKYKSSIECFKDAIKRGYGPDMVVNTEEVHKKLFDFYTSNIDVTNKLAREKALAKFIGDSEFNIGALNSAKSCAKHSKGSNVYLGSFDYYDMSAPDVHAEYLPFRSAAHGSDLRFIMGDAGLFPFNPTEEELKVMDMMGKIVTNFAKYGNPNGKEGSEEKWEKYSLSQPNRYFKIDYPKSEMRDNFQNGRLEIIDEINRNGKKYQEIIYGKKF